MTAVELTNHFLFGFEAFTTGGNDVSFCKHAQKHMAKTVNRKLITIVFVCFVLFVFYCCWLVLFLFNFEIIIELHFYPPHLNLQSPSNLWPFY